MKTLRWLPPALGVGHTCWVSGIVYVRERPNRDTCIVKGCASRPKHLKSTVIRRGFISGVDAGRRARLLVTPQVTFHHQHSIDPAEKLSVVVKEVQSLYKVLLAVLRLSHSLPCLFEVDFSYCQTDCMEPDRRSRKIPFSVCNTLWRVKRQSCRTSRSCRLIFGL